MRLVREGAPIPYGVSHCKTTHYLAFYVKLPLVGLWIWRVWPQFELCHARPNWTYWRTWR